MRNNYLVLLIISILLLQACNGENVDAPIEKSSWQLSGTVGCIRFAWNFGYFVYNLFVAIFFKDFHLLAEDILRIPGLAQMLFRDCLRE
ncbi:unnamed protein product [Moneuplotes crassus]|uniref:Lipoprotein n=1 Tax=Euplotes crassus TaxID=5936 RepID=A0AAD2D8G3_EUPCR|nr:unnamed protein product [Moneuplotes crassus]